MSTPTYIAARVHLGSWDLIHATVDRPAERESMGAGRMGFYGRTLCGLKGRPSDGMPFMRPIEHKTAVAFADFLDDPGDSRPCPKCRAAFRRDTTMSRGKGGMSA